MTKVPTDAQSGDYPLHRRLGLIAGPTVAVAMLLLPPPGGLSSTGWSVAAIGVVMAVWWMTEALPLAATALLPLVLLPPLGVVDLETTARSYAHPLIFLFLGGFLLARSMQFWKLDRRIALQVLRIGGARPSHMIASIMATTAFLSMWVSNTATAMMMLPIGQSVIAGVQKSFGDEKASDVSAFATALMLGIGYAATIGGMGTLIGTPPNALFAGYMSEAHGISIGFSDWMLIGIPAVVILLPLAWLVLTRLTFRFSLPEIDTKRAGLARDMKRLGPMTRAESLIAVLLTLTAVAWISRPFVQQIVPSLGLSDAGIAMTAAFLLFVIPVQVKDGTFLLSWQEARKIRWDVLILFGGGLALADSIGSSGLAAWIGSALNLLEILPKVALIVTVAALVVLLGELASNTAMAAIFLPIAGATAVGLGEDPVLLTLPIALAATVGFMLPVATPPNAIIFGSGAVTIAQMVRAGALLDVAGVFVVTALGLMLGAWVFGGI